MKSVSADCPHHEACTAAQVLTSQGEKGAKWGRREAKKKPSRVKWGCAGFGNWRNFERSTIVAGLASCWRNRQPQPPCLDRTGVSRILMSTRGKEREREKGGTYWKTRQKTYQKRSRDQTKKGLKRRNAQGSGRYESQVTWDGMPFIWASCNAVTCSQRPCVSSETSETDTLQQIFFFFADFFSNSNDYPTHATWWIVTCHRGIRRAAWKHDVICMSDDCACPCCSFIKYFQLLSSFHTLLPFSHSKLA